MGEMVKITAKEEIAFTVTDGVEQVFLQLYSACLAWTALGLTFSEKRREQGGGKIGKKGEE